MNKLLSSHWFLMASFSLLFALFLTGNNLRANFGIIDDHEIFSFLGADMQISVSEFPQRIMETEVGRYGETNRYRPSYYALRLIEARLWGDNPTLWYGARIVMLSFSMFSLWFLVSSFTNKTLGALFVMYTMTFRYWVDVWTRLGPSETYAVFGLSLYAIGSFFMMQKKTNSGLVHIFSWVAIVSGFLISVGVKENFLLLTIHLFYLLYHSIIHKNYQETLTTFLLSLYSIWISAAVYLGLRQTGADVYGKKVNFFERLQSLGSVEMLGNKYTILFLIGLFVVGVVHWHYRHKKIAKKDIQAMARYWYLMLVAAIIAFSQILFYSLSFPTGTRYDFPFMLSLLFFILFGYLFFSHSLIANKVYGGKKFVQTLVYIVLSVGIVRSGYAPIRTATQNNMDKTISFYNSIVKTKNTLEKNPDIPLIFTANSAVYYEQIASVHRYLYHMGVENEVYLKFDNVAAENALAVSLSSLLNDVSENGGEGDKWGFLPLTNFDNSSDCYTIIFGNQPNNDCVLLAEF